MKTIFVILALIFGANALSKEQFERIWKEVQEVGTECKEKENADQTDLAELLAFKIPPTNKGGKCILACFYEHYHMMRPDGTFDKEQALKAFQELKDMDPELFGKVAKIIDTCEAKYVDPHDRCEGASVMAVCVKAETDAAGITREALMSAKA